MFKYDVYAQLLADQIQKDFWVFYMFLKVILYFHALSFCLKCIFALFFKKLVQRHFREKLATKSFPRKEFKENLKISFSYKEYRDCLATISWPSTSREIIFRQKLEKHKFHTKAIATVSRLFRNCFATKASRKASGLQWCFLQLILRLSNLRKTRVFSFIRLMWQCFKHSISLALPFLNLSQPKTDFLSKPHHFQAYFLQNQLQGMFSSTFFSFLS